jgi:hypothetical protein
VRRWYLAGCYAKSFVCDAGISLGGAKSLVCDAAISLGGAKSSVCDAGISLGGAKSFVCDAGISLGATLRASCATLVSRWAVPRASCATLISRLGNVFRRFADGSGGAGISAAGWRAAYGVHHPHGPSSAAPAVVRRLAARRRPRCDAHVVVPPLAERAVPRCRARHRRRRRIPPHLVRKRGLSAVGIRGDSESSSKPPHPPS